MNFYKKSCLILLPIFLASSVQAATVYNDEAKGVSLSVFGRIETGFYNKFSEINESSDEDDAKARVHGEGRLGVMGKSRIASNVYGLAFGEWEVTTQTSADGFTNQTTCLVTAEDPDGIYEGANQEIKISWSQTSMLDNVFFVNDCDFYLERKK